MDVPVLRYPNRIFVGGVAFQTTAIELRELFESYGAVRDVKIARDGEGVSRGYGFVTFFRDDDAKKVFKLGTVFYKGKRLVIGEAYRKLQFTYHSHVPRALRGVCPGRLATQADFATSSTSLTYPTHDGTTTVSTVSSSNTTNVSATTTASPTCSISVITPIRTASCHMAGCLQALGSTMTEAVPLKALKEDYKILQDFVGFCQH
ncbi:predicted protein [Nematostella vectensis]|uniref:RRM domain-containing protein n=1 Tax=Nematostella vectensis TaxID=45351 RepID=A7RTC5_NEMVE|nr:predicted protein [Nematostella vectensis]|eukprot:XP_001637248.1 predicted protein [Nematostella vectensis]